MLRISPRIALITGITGQDGGFLAQLLLDKGYEVHGMRRRSSSSEDGHERLGESGLTQRVRLHYGDMTDPASVIRVVHDSRPDEVYNLAAQSHVKVSFENPAYTAQVNALGCLHLLEAIRLLDLVKGTRFYRRRPPSFTATPRRRHSARRRRSTRARHMQSRSTSRC